MNNESRKKLRSRPEQLHKKDATTRKASPKLEPRGQCVSAKNGRLHPVKMPKQTATRIQLVPGCMEQAASADGERFELLGSMKVKGAGRASRDQFLKVMTRNEWHHLPVTSEKQGVPSSTDLESHKPTHPWGGSFNGYYASSPKRLVLSTLFTHATQKGATTRKTKSKDKRPSGQWPAAPVQLAQCGKRQTDPEPQLWLSGTEKK